jgi:Putative zinc-finger
MRTPSSPEEKRTRWCLNEFQLASYLDGTVSGRRRRRIELHLAKCERCRREVSLLVHSQRESSQSVPPEWLARVRDLGEQVAIKRPWRWAIAGVAGTALACSLILGTLVAHRHQSPVNLAKAAATVAGPSTASSPDSEQVRELGKSIAEPMVIAPAAGATVTSDLELQWQPVPAALTYDLVILNADGDTVWHTRTNGQSFHVPDSVLVDHGAEYFVMISANLSSGKTVRARAIPFRVQKK